MGAATKTSTAAAVEALDALPRLDADLGDQLLSVARAIGGSNQLASVLADPGVPVEQRRALADRIFADAGEQARQVLAAAVTGRWSESGDLVVAVEQLGYRALAKSSAGTGTARAVRQTRKVKADAARIDAEPSSAGTDGLQGELFTVARAISSEGRLELALGSAAPVEVRLALVDRLLDGFSAATRAIVRHVVQAPRGRKPIEALEEAQSIVAAARDRLVAVVQTATPLNGGQASAIADRLAAVYGRKISINQTVDPSLIGGVRIIIGDDVIDGTVRARLDDLRLRLAG